ncbi:recombinase family protein [Pseudomonas mosselii]|uniref:recombinase family protein n=1 Tax=Pseudomonas mosselii TaxID=78327 RepID=UPI001F1727A8|nr:recombinase family protein [Pseudomonas mosselii]
MPAAIPYIRFSTGKQKHGNSEERQHQMVMSWLGQNPNHTLSDLKYSDLGKSGYKGDHIKDGGGFAMLLEAVEAGAIKPGDVVLVEAIDRTGRLSPLKMLNTIISPIIEAGVSIVTLDDNVTYDSGSIDGGHLFLLVAKIQAAHGYSKQLSERVTASYGIRRQQAIEGKAIKRWTPIWLTVDGVLKEAIAPYIKQAFEWYVSGIGKTTIANRLRGSGVPELATCSGPTVEAWLRNKAAIGTWEYHKGREDAEDIPNVYEPVVTPELFMQAQRRKKEVATKPRERTSKHFLVGLVKCGVCGSSYIIHHKDGKPNNLRCGTYHRLKKAGCTNDETIPYQVAVYIYSETATHWVDKALQQVQLTVNDKRKLVLENERDTLTASITTLTEKAVALDIPELWNKLEEESSRRKFVDEELSVLERTPDAGGGFAAVLAQDQMMIHDPIQLSALLRQVEYSIVVYPNKLFKVAGELYPWLYLGPKRKPKSNVTLGYRILYLAQETIISPVLPVTLDWGKPTDNPVEQMRYYLRRAYKLVSAPQPYEYNDDVPE